MKLGDSIRHGTKWLFLGGMGGQVLQFVFGVVLARLLVPEDFGLLITMQIFTGFVGMVASGGMGEAIIQAKAVEEEDYLTVFTFQITAGILIYLIFYVVAPAFASWFEEPVYKDLLRVSALSFLIRPFSNNPAIRLRRAMRFKETAVIRFISAVFTGISSICLALLGWGVWSLVLSGMAGALLNVLMLATRAPWRPKLYYSQQSAKRLGTYGAKSILNELLVYFRRQTPNFVISKLLGPASVGLYNKGASLAATPHRLISGSTYQTVFRALSKVHDDINQSRYIYFRTLRLLGFYSFPIFLALVFVAEPFIVGLYGEKWRAATWPLIVLCAAAPFRILEIASGALVAARNRLGRESVLQSQAFLLLGVASVIAAPYGIRWVAVAAVFTYAFIGLRLCALGLATIGGRWRDVAHAFTPVLVLCAVELVVLGVAYISCNSLAIDDPYARLLLIAGSGVAVYGLIVLFFPPKGLRNESNRWRLVVHLNPVEN